MNIQKFEDYLSLSVHLPNRKQAQYLIEKGVVIDSNIPNVDTEVLNKAIDYFGTPEQIDKTIEELSELTKALLKERYARMTEHHTEAIDNVCEELADAIIMLNQIAIIFTERYHAFRREELQRMIDFKIERLKGKLEKGGVQE